jgi:hypothetical protein
VTKIVGRATYEAGDEAHLRVIACWANVDAQLVAQVVAGLGDGGGMGGHVFAQAGEVVAGRAKRA